MLQSINDISSKYKLLFITEFEDIYHVKQEYHMGSLKKSKFFNEELNEEVSEKALYKHLSQDKYEIISYFSMIPFDNIEKLSTYISTNTKINSNVIDDFKDKIDRTNRESRKCGTFHYKFLIFKDSERPSVLMSTVSYEIKWDFYNGYYNKFLNATFSKFNYFEKTSILEQSNVFNRSLSDEELEERIKGIEELGLEDIEI